MREDKVIFIFGPTAVGKTELACELAEGIGEIISADSMQVYKELNLGTAKPTEENQKRVEHHLVNIVPPDRRFSAGDFKRLALKTIKEIIGRGKIPFLVGGTGLYFRALEYDLIDAPPARLELRDSLYRMEEKQRGCLYERLMAVDPKTARSLHPNDLLRIVRALEIYYVTNRKLSELLPKVPFGSTGSQGHTEQLKQIDPLKIGITINREELYGRIESRCRRMIVNGLGAEVYRLMMKGYTEKLSSMKGLGYSHFIQYFKGCLSHEETVRLFIRDTKRYAKRQLTWFRREPETWWYHPIEIEAMRQRILFYIR